MMEQPAGVYEVKAARREVIDGNIMPYGFKIAQFYILKELNIDVGGDDTASWPDLLTQPSCN